MANAPAARHTLQLLTLLARHTEPLPAGSIARELGLPRSTTYHLLAVLRDAGFVTHLEEERRYGLGVAAFELSAELVRTRSRGWGQETGEVTEGLETASVAARDHRGLPVASVALTCRSEGGQVDDEQRERYVLRQAAAKLSARLYGIREREGA